MKTNRINKVLSSMVENNIPQMLISDPFSIYYLTGHWCKSGERFYGLLLDTEGNHHLFLNALFPSPDDSSLNVVRYGDTDDPITILADYLVPHQRLGIDKNLAAKFLLHLQEMLSQLQCVNGSFIIDSARRQKDEEEIALMRASTEINIKAMDQLIKKLPEEHSEKTMARILDDIYSNLGAEELSFPSHISYGKNTAIGHHVPGADTPQNGDCVKIDIGCVKDRYCSDMMRTIFYRTASDKMRDIYSICLESTLTGIEAVKPGVRFCDIDAAARGVIERAGYGDYFLHRTGHCIGLQAHDAGDVSAANTDIVLPGMIFSIEPGISLPGEFGINVEDLVLVTENGHDVLTKYNREFTIINQMISKWEDDLLWQKQTPRKNGLLSITG